MYETSGMFLAQVRVKLRVQPVIAINVPASVKPELAYMYTVGLTGYGHPELLMAGASPETAGPILTTLGLRVARGEARYEHGGTVGDLIDGGYPLTFAGPVTPDVAGDYPIPVAVAINPAAGPPLQVIYTDTAGRFPWQPGYNADGQMAQPVLAPIPGFPDPAAYLAAWTAEYGPQ